MATKTTLDRETWLQKSLDVLRKEGIGGVRVERLARDLGVTKGSFYWHFEDREDLHASILEYWSDQYNSVITNNPGFLEGDPAEGLLAAMIVVREQGLDAYELAIRTWAESDARAANVVEKIYKRRADFLGMLFERMGFRGLQAEIRTRMALCYLSWEPNMYPDEPASRRSRMLKLQHELLIRK